jgi:hypothetical protein
MKAILEFTLPDDEDEYRASVAGNKAFLALSEIANHLRGYKHRELSKKEIILWDEIRDAFYAIVNDRLPGMDF